MSEPAVLLASLIPEDLPKRERERAREREVPFQRNDNWLSYTSKEEEEKEDEMLCSVTLHASRVILDVLRRSRKW